MPDQLEQFRANVEKTIGVDHELIVIDNTENRYNIFQAYNLGIQQSRYPYLCFAHEDILFHTANWGQNCIKHFENNDIGLIATMGGTAFPSCPAPWWNNETLNQPYLNMIQRWGDRKPRKEWIREIIDEKENVIHQYHNPDGKEIADVVAVDGFFFCIKKELFSSCRFDDTTFDGFHCYDTDICFQVLEQGKRVAVVFDILIEHFSLGDINLNWAESVEKLSDKWKNRLPFFSGNPDNQEKVSLYSYKALLTYCYWIRDLSIPDRRIREIIKKYLSRIKFTKRFKEYLLLYLWMHLGYKLARIPYMGLKLFFK